MFTKLSYIYGMKYLNGKIYKIVDNTNGNIYIGSTCLSLKERLKGHRGKYTEYKKKEGKGNSSYDIIKNNDYKIELLEDYPCKFKQELLKKEREYIENNTCINIYRPITTYQERLDKEKEYKKNNIDKVKIYWQNDYKKNKAKKLERNKIYYEANKDKIIESHKEYREKNRDKVLESRKNHYEANKDKINKIASEKIQCDNCSSITRRGDIAKHKKTLKCQNYKKDTI